LLSSDRAPEIATRTARTARKRPRERFTARTARTARKRPRERFTARSLERYSNPERARASNARARKTRPVAIHFEGG
jgi:hypothetical protein